MIDFSEAIKHMGCGRGSQLRSCAMSYKEDFRFKNFSIVSETATVKSN